MAIELRRGNILEADAEALVNTVNCVGVMGKGIALQFKNAYPDNFAAYEKACRKKAITTGRMHVYETGRLYPRYIINFPTKRHWKGKSSIGDIAKGLKALVVEVRNRAIHSIAIPPLGCGNGGLEWKTVAPLIVSAFDAVPNVHVDLYEPVGAPNADAMPIATTKPNMTRTRALLLAVMNEYATRGYRLTLLEIQKLAYFLQASGEQLDLQFTRYKCGPYSERLNHLLQRLEGHNIRGYGDRSREASIRVLSSEEVDTYISTDQVAAERLKRVKQLIEGFETPYGMELLSTVHWVAQEEPSIAKDSGATVTAVHKWSRRKSHLFTENHIVKAWSKLNRLGWLDASHTISI
jgi:O-acetyl-ADP-ribose deacetylase (regulator of RNase III)